MTEKLITQDVLAYDMGILWAIADKHQGIFSEELVDCFCRGLASPTSLISVCDLLLRLSGRDADENWRDGIMAMGLVAQRDARITLNRLTILTYLSDRLPSSDLADLLATILVLGLPVTLSEEGFGRQQAQLKAAGKIFEHADVADAELAVPAQLLFASLPECADVVATEFANDLPGSVCKAVFHDICLFAPFLTAEGLTLPSSVQVMPISPLGQSIQDLLKVEDPFLT